MPFLPPVYPGPGRLAAPSRQLSGWLPRLLSRPFTTFRSCHVQSPPCHMRGGGGPGFWDLERVCDSWDIGNIDDVCNRPHGELLLADAQAPRMRQAPPP